MLGIPSNSAPESCPGPTHVDASAVQLASVLERHRALLRRNLVRALGPNLSRHVDADDVLQDAFVIALHRAADVDCWTEARLVAWLNGIAMNRVRDVLRHHDRLRRRADEPESVDDVVSEPARPASTDPALDLIRQELTEIALACRESLKPEHRDVLLLRDGFGVSWSTIAIVIGRPSASAARKLFARARREWRDRFLHELRSGRRTNVDERCMTALPIPRDRDERAFRPT